MNGVVNVQKKSKLKKPVFIYAKSLNKEIFREIKNLNLMLTESEVQFSVTENNILMEQNLDFNFSQLPIKCRPLSYEPNDYSVKLITKSCWHDPLVLNKSGLIKEYFFYTLPSVTILLKNVFKVGPYQFVLNLNDHIFYFDGPERELNFIGKGEVIFAVPSENIISITKRE